MLNHVVNRFIDQQRWLEPVADFLQKIVAGSYKLLGNPGRSLKARASPWERLRPGYEATSRFGVASTFRPYSAAGPSASAAASAVGSGGRYNAAMHLRLDGWAIVTRCRRHGRNPIASPHAAHGRSASSPARSRMPLRGTRSSGSQRLPVGSRRRSTAWACAWRRPDCGCNPVRS